MINYSVIIPTKNRAKSLIRCLNSINKNNVDNFDKFELLVIDNGSTDNTQKLVKDFIYENKKFDIKYYFEKEPGLIAARHCAVKNAKGEILIFVDDDVEVSSYWLQSLVNVFKDEEVKLAGGRNLPKYESSPPDWIKWFWIENKYGKFLWQLSLLDFGNTRKIIKGDFIFGLNFAIRKSALKKIGGFHPDYIDGHLLYEGDGETFVTRKAMLLGYKMIYEPRALVYHHLPASRLTRDYFCKRYYKCGINSSYMDIRRHLFPDEFIPFNGNTKIIDFQKIKRQISRVFLHINKIINRNNNEIETVPLFIQKMNKLFDSQYLKGYKEHQKSVSNDTNLAIWVKKKNYWDYRLPN